MGLGLLSHFTGMNDDEENQQQQNPNLLDMAAQAAQEQQAGQQANLKPPANFGIQGQTVDGGQSEQAAQQSPMLAKPDAMQRPVATAQQPQFNGVIHLSDPTNGKSMTKGFKNFMEGMSKFYGGGMGGG